MTNEEYLKQLAKHAQRNSDGPKSKPDLKPGTKKVDIQFFKRRRYHPTTKISLKVLKILTLYFHTLIIMRTIGF